MFPSILTRLFWACAIIGFLQLGCASQSQPKTSLRVQLYRYIPDAAGDQFKAMAARIEKEFEESNPGIDLILNPSCFKDDFYEPGQLSRSLKGEGECKYDVIEADTVILGELVAEGGVRPWSALPSANWHPAGVASSTHTDQKALYGVPHWLCGHFVISRDEAVRQARTTSALVRALAARNTAVPDMSVNMLGSWNLPSLYLDGWADAHGLVGVESALKTTDYDQEVLQSMRAFARACESSGGNPCLDGTYDREENEDLPAKLFAEDKVDATLGYSERLHVILKNLPAGEDSAVVKISSAPFAEGTNPLLFTDAYFLGARCTGECEKAASAFVQYMSQASTFEWILMSEDASENGRVPRYLLPANLDAYKAPKLQADAFYPALAAETLDGGAFPNSGVYSIRKQMRDAIKQAMTSAH
ncbi:hypothetical protein HJC10_07085 [Corallococcus exiguus]|uniref:hypothetical protein n=1 Tax=Corallococcus exiguus TaxID=83462 RepID=UPI001472675E|nr:hypothetical protein [Corallococcus exiguus]NNB94891.1 hypothetical protein [Corallococcus exiguus]NNC02614.1 hypothetical protein [Corallococcus exiguus]